MSSELLEIGKAQVHYNVAETRILKYSCEMYHKGLKEHKIISAPEIDMLENKVNLQAAKWLEKWKKLETRKNIAEEKEANIEEATRKTEQCTRDITQIENILMHTLSIDDAVDWDSLKKKNTFSEEKPR